MKLVPSKPGGASRRAYHNAYTRSSTNKVSDLLGKSKLSTPAFKQPRGAKGGKPLVNKNDKKQTGPEVSFGATGYTEEDYYG